VVTEAGFGADLGAEKFMNIKCRKAGLAPDAVVLVATVRAMKMNGGVAKADLGARTWRRCKEGLRQPRPAHRERENFGVPVVVAINHFAGDTEAEIEAVKAYVAEQGSEAILCRTGPRARCGHRGTGAQGRRACRKRAGAVQAALSRRDAAVREDRAIAKSIYRAAR
jgi:formate--tetrahydrofolate ligase